MRSFSHFGEKPELEVLDDLDEDSLIQIPIKVSMGVASLQPDSNLADLIRAADAALYRAKKAGRNIVCN